MATGSFDANQLVHFRHQGKKETVSYALNVVKCTRSQMAWLYYLVQDPRMRVLLSDQDWVEITGVSLAVLNNEAESAQLDHCRRALWRAFAAQNKLPPQLLRNLHYRWKGDRMGELCLEMAEESDRGRALLRDELFFLMHALALSLVKSPQRNGEEQCIVIYKRATLPECHPLAVDILKEHAILLRVIEELRYDHAWVYNRVRPAGSPLFFTSALDFYSRCHEVLPDGASIVRPQFQAARFGQLSSFLRTLLWNCFNDTRQVDFSHSILFIAPLPAPPTGPAKRRKI